MTIHLLGILAPSFCLGVIVGLQVARRIFSD